MSLQSIFLSSKHSQEHRSPSITMEKRSTESPMDFEWQTRAHGDVTSPFYQLSVQHDNQKKRTHSIFESPTRQPFPALREPNSQPFLFSQPTSTAPSSRQNVTFGNPSFTTPRKVNLDFSSGGENASSPEIADNEETPEQPTRREKRNSLFGMYGRWAPSPGRGEIPRLTNYSNALARRVEKRRRRDRGIDRRLRRDSEGDSDADRKASQKELEPQKHQQEPTKPSRFASFSDFFALIEAHPNVPSILSWWAQLVVNLSLFSLATYVVFAFVSAIRSEFDQAAEEVSDTILAEMAVCARNYVDNRCAGGERLPALETVCDNWERCMNRDPAKVGRAKVSAHTMAIIINSFIDPISWKAILCFLATISTVTVVSNWSFRSFRTKLSQQEYMHPNSMHAPPPPPTPHHHVPAQQLQYSQSDFNRAVGYNQHPSQETQVSPSRQKKEEPLMIEDTPSRAIGFVTERSREREQHIRTPSPSKKNRTFFG